MNDDELLADARFDPDLAGVVGSTPNDDQPPTWLISNVDALAVYAALPVGQRAGVTVERLAAAIETTAPHWRARWVAEELDKMADEFDQACEHRGGKEFVAMRRLFGRTCRKRAGQYRAHQR